MSVTTKDLAQICNVSRTTVSRALHGNGRINPATKKRILDTANKLGYEPDLAARTLVSGKSMMIGVIVVNLKNQYYPRIVNAVAERVLEDDYILNITVHRDDKAMESKLISVLTGHRVDGLIISPINKGAAFYKMMENVDIPYCVLGIDEFKDCPCVGVDEVAAGVDAAKYILKKGFTNIAFVAPPLYDSDGILNIGHHKRLTGFKSVMDSQDLGYELITEQKDEEYLEKVLKFVKSSKKEKPALLCSGAVFAMEIMGYLRQHGLNAPKEYGIMTFDKLRENDNLWPRLTCIDNHTSTMGRAAGELIVKMIKGEETEKRVVIPYDIVEGDTL
ncbi:MAG: LacI family transcriptional regulator [Butyrivibrio sp.]|nr:LacI family transcriptional regulator [Butyrivibrio sp.]